MSSPVLRFAGKTVPVQHRSFLQGSGQPGQALHLRYERDGVKMVPAPELSLRGRFAPVTP